MAIRTFEYSVQNKFEEDINLEINIFGFIICISDKQIELPGKIKLWFLSKIFGIKFRKM